MSVSFANQSFGFPGQRVPIQQSVSPKSAHGSASGFFIPVPDKHHVQPDHLLNPAYSVQLNPGLFKSPQANYRNVVGHAPQQVPVPPFPAPKPEYGQTEIPTTPYPKPAAYPYPAPYPIPGPAQHPPPYRPTREEYRPDLQKPSPADLESIGVHGFA
ncbi:MAG: hypothetical protein O3B01_29060 [Planctomycetota bacterium]|nr:hypothetical protein [Planctomycetota bacterium]MDA1142634.1 hypothetical protein [Planctomycetota bacterium]